VETHPRQAELITITTEIKNNSDFFEENDDVEDNI
jgi:hypothetical protein